MNKRTLIIGLTLVALVAIILMLGSFPAPSVSARPVRLVITGPDGQHFTGSYAADGVTNYLSAVAPVTIDFRARNVTYEFRREGGNGEFRVALFVEDLCRSSATSDRRQGVQGALHYDDAGEKYWADRF